MFTDSFGLDFGGNYSQDYSFNQSQDDPVRTTQAHTGPRPLGAGVLPATVATCVNAQRKGDLDDGKPRIHDQIWSSVVLCGWITSVDCVEGDVWIGEMRDSTGTMSFRYELRTDLTEKYTAELQKVKPILQEGSEDQENNAAHGKKGVIQWPARLIGVPQVINGDLILMTSHIRMAEFEEAVATHLLECAAAAVSAVEERVVEETKAVVTEPEEKNEKKDPYGDEPIEVEDAERAELIGTDRLKQCIYRFIKEASEKPFKTDESESTVAVRAFCRSKWTEEEVRGAMDDMESCGVLFYMDDSKTRVCLA